MTDIDERLADHAARWQRAVVLPAVPESLAARPVPSRRRAAVAAVAAGLAVAATTTAVALRSSGDPAPPVAAGAADATRAPVAPSPAQRPADLDRYAPGDVAFFRPLSAGGGGGSEAERYASLRDAYLSAGVVVVAQVVEVRPTRTFGADGDAVPYAGVVLRPVEVLRGALRHPSAELVVEFATDARAVSATVPQGYGIWLLRNKAEAPPGRGKGVGPESEAAYYRLVSSQGLFVQGAEHVANPVARRAPAEPGSPSEGLIDPVTREGESFRALSALADHLRALR
jgi:hypothetical protein